MVRRQAMDSAATAGRNWRRQPSNVVRTRWSLRCSSRRMAPARDALNPPQTSSPMPSTLAVSRVTAGFTRIHHF